MGLFVIERKINQKRDRVIPPGDISLRNDPYYTAQNLCTIYKILGTSEKSENQDQLKGLEKDGQVDAYMGEQTFYLIRLRTLESSEKV